jgi:hypothetical protein
VHFCTAIAVLSTGYPHHCLHDRAAYSYDGERATRVRDYLVKKFTLSPDYVGVMPMGAVEGYGDGVALVLLKK